MYADNLWVGQKYEHLKWTDLFEIHVIELQKQLIGGSGKIVVDKLVYLE